MKSKERSAESGKSHPESLLLSIGDSVDLRKLKRQVLQSRVQKEKELKEFYVQKPNYVKDIEEATEKLEKERSEVDELASKLKELREVESRRKELKESIETKEDRVKYLRVLKAVVSYLEDFCSLFYTENLSQVVESLNEVENFFSEKNFLENTELSRILLSKLRSQKQQTKKFLEMNAYHLEVSFDESMAFIGFALESFSIERQMPQFLYLMETIGCLEDFEGLLMKKIEDWCARTIRKLESNEIEFVQTNNKFQVKFIEQSTTETENNGQYFNNLLEFYELVLIIFKKFCVKNFDSFTEFFIEEVIVPNITNDSFVKSLTEIEAHPAAVKKFLSSIDEKKVQLECMSYVKNLRDMIIHGDPEVSVFVLNDVDSVFVASEDVKGRFSVFKSAHYLIEKSTKMAQKSDNEDDKNVKEFIGLSYDLFHMLQAEKFEKMKNTETNELILLYNSVKYVQMHALRFTYVRRNFLPRVTILYSDLARKIEKRIAAEHRDTVEDILEDMKETIADLEKKGLKMSQKVFDRIVQEVEGLQLLLEPYCFQSRSQKGKIVSDALLRVMHVVTMSILKFSDISIDECDNIELLFEYMLSSGAFKSVDENSYEYQRFMSVKGMMGFKLIDISRRFMEKDGINGLSANEVKALVVALFSDSVKRKKCLDEISNFSESC